MAKLTARFDLQDRMTSRLRAIRGEMVRIDRLRQRTEQRPFVIRVRDRASQTLRRIHMFILRDIGKSHQLVLSVKDLATRSMQKMNRFIARRMPRTHEIMMKVVDRATPQILRLRRYLDRHLSGPRRILIEAKDRATAVIRRISRYAKDQLGRGYNVTVRAVDMVTKTVNRIVSSARREIPEYYRSSIQAIDRFTAPARRVTSFANQHLNRTWTATVKVLDLATKPLKAIASAATSTLGILGVGAGATGGVVVPLKMVADRQNMTTAFETLLGSQAKANQRLDELTTFAGQTPFTRDEIFESSRVLQVFTGNALSTAEGMKLVGDVAAGVQRPFSEVALWMGRLYDGIKSGRPIGDATAALQEMGAISGEARGKLEKLAESGQDISKTWPQVTKEFSKYNDMMVKMSDNLANLFLGVKSFINNSILMPWGKGLAEAFQPALEAFREWRGEYSFVLTDLSNKAQKAGKAFAESFLNPTKNVFGFIGEQFKILFPGELTKKQKKELELKFKEDPKLKKRFDQLQKYRDMDFETRWHIVLDNTKDVFGEWWKKTGEPGLIKMAGNLGSTYGGIINGVINGLLGIDDKSSENGFVNAGTKAGRTFVVSFVDALDPVELSMRIAKKLAKLNWDAVTGQGSVGGALLADAFALAFIGKVGRLLKPVGKLVSGVFAGYKWLKNKPGSSGRTGGLLIPGGKNKRAGGGRRGPEYRNPWFGQGERVSPSNPNQTRGGGFWSKAGKGAKSVGKRVPILGTALAATELIGMNKDNAGEKLGGFGGGLGGSAAGAAAGSVVPVVGTAIGGLVGGILGATGGEKLGQWLQDNWSSIKRGASEVGQWISDKFTVAKDAVSETLFNSGWWGEKWDGVKNWTSEKLSDTAQWWEGIKQTASDTFFNASWWLEKAGFIYGYLESSIFNGEWWSSKWEAVKEKTAGTMFDPAWWGEKWEAVKTWTSEKWDSAVEVWESVKTKFADTVFNPDWWSGKWESVKAWSQEKWDSAVTVWNSVRTKFEETVFNSDWWLSKWEAVKGWAQTKWDAAAVVWTSVQNKINETIFSSDWWNGKWESVRTWTKDKWDSATTIWESVKTAIGDTLFSADWWSGKWESVVGWGKQKLEGLKTWASDLWEKTKSPFQAGREKGKQATAYANGGYINRPHLGLVGEAGPEMIIPLSQSKRARALSLYEQTGKALGVRAYANGGQVGGSVKVPTTQPVQASVNVGSVSVQGMDKEAKLYGESFTNAIASGINGKVVSLNAWKKNNIENPMQGVVQEAVGFGAGTVTSFSAGQNATPTNTAAYLAKQVKTPFTVIQGGASQWGAGTVSGFRSGQDATQTGTRPYLVTNVHTPFNETRAKGSNWGSGTAAEFVAGMRAQSGQMAEAAKYLAQQVEKTFRQELGIASPSKVMMKHGMWTAMGIVKGLGSVDIKKFAEKQAGSLAGAFAGMGAVGGNIKDWLQKALMITGTSMNWLGPLSQMAMHESGGNPRAINLWDSNAKRGTPSKGLMQTIDPTFNAYKMKGLNDIWNPIHNAVAAINYIKARYGSVFNTPGMRSKRNGGSYKGYANGGLITNEQIARVGEGGKREWIIPEERGIRGRYLLSQAAQALGLDVIDPSSQQSGMSSDQVDIATSGQTGAATVVPSGNKEINIHFNGDQHFHNDQDVERLIDKIKQALVDELEEDINIGTKGSVAFD